MPDRPPGDIARALSELLDRYGTIVIRKDAAIMSVRAGKEERSSRCVARSLDADTLRLCRADVMTIHLMDMVHLLHKEIG